MVESLTRPSAAAGSRAGRPLPNRTRCGPTTSTAAAILARSSAPDISRKMLTDLMRGGDAVAPVRAAHTQKHELVHVVRFGELQVHFHADCIGRVQETRFLVAAAGVQYLVGQKGMQRRGGIGAGQQDAHKTLAAQQLFDRSAHWRPRGSGAPPGSRTESRFDPAWLSECGCRSAGLPARRARKARWPIYASALQQRPQLRAVLVNARKHIAFQSKRDNREWT